MKPWLSTIDGLRVEIGAELIVFVILVEAKFTALLYFPTVFSIDDSITKVVVRLSPALLNLQLL